MPPLKGDFMEFTFINSMMIWSRASAKEKRRRAYKLEREDKDALARRVA
jgi:hypothetical protein